MQTNTFVLLSLSLSCSSRVLSYSKIERRFRNLFGVSPSIFEKLWRKVRPRLNRNTEPSHLLWVLNFLKNYYIKYLNRIILNVDETTFRTYVWHFLHELKVLVWYVKSQNLKPFLKRLIGHIYRFN